LAVNFDPVAKAYRWMEYLSFGPFLERCRETYLARLTTARRALVLGDGDGRFLACLLAINPSLEVDVVDSSGSMLRVLQSRIGGHPQVRLHHVDALAWEPAGTYDLIVTHFFLDCFFPAQVEQLFDRVLPHAQPGAQWVISEFAIPANRLLALLAGALVAMLYRTFFVLTGLQVRKLPDYSIPLRERGLLLAGERPYLAGLLTAQLWSLREVTNEPHCPTQK
jgi:ubiquinone/menaquinone biosynthesis C-methylase UbiE